MKLPRFTPNAERNKRMSGMMEAVSGPRELIESMPVKEEFSKEVDKRTDELKVIDTMYKVLVRIMDEVDEGKIKMSATTGIQVSNAISDAEKMFGDLIQK